MGFLSDLASSGISIGDIASAGASIYQTRENSRVAKENTDKTIRANKELAQYQYSKDLEMWNKQNEYNSPLSQMNRFAQAGLNKNLIYGQGSSGNATTLPKYQSPTVRYDYMPKTNLPEVLSAFQDFKMKNAQIDNVKQDTQNKAMTNIIQGLNREWLSDRNNYLSGNLGYWQNRMVQETNKTSKSLSESQLASYNASYRKKQVENFDRLLQMQIDQTNSMIRKNNLGSDLTEIDLGTRDWMNKSKIGQVFGQLLPYLFHKK